MKGLKAEDLLLPMFVLVAIASAAAILRRRRQLAEDQPEAGVSFGPVDMIDERGNVTATPTGTTEVLVPRPGDVSNVGYTPDAGVAVLCAGSPLRSFGPACEGYTWVRQPTIFDPNARVDLRTLN